MKKRLVLLAAGWLGSVMTAMAEIPTVEVDFHIADRRFQNELGTMLPSAESTWRPILVRTLAKEIGFLRFSPDPVATGAPRYHLVIQLGDSTSSRGEVRFKLSLLTPAGVAVGRPVSWQF